MTTCTLLLVGKMSESKSAQFSGAILRNREGTPVSAHV